MIYIPIPPEELYRPPERKEEIFKLRGYTATFAQGKVCGGQMTLTRIISTDPGIYLNKKFSPGCTIKL